MPSSTFSWPAFHAAPVVAILRGQSLATCLEITKTLQKAGFATLEVTMNTPDVANIIAELNRQFPDFNVGAGTVCTPKELDTALEAGASFIVTPILDEEVVTTCVKCGIPVFPGAYTPTEIFKAWQLGASAVKVFPAGGLGVKYIKDLSGPLPQIKLMPTGGVSLSNIRAFFEAGVVGVGMGSSLLDKSLIAAGDFARLEQHLLTMRAQIEDFTS
jgi:2-dehydro-3-deoxyphosphogluconate aldolase/(4S)-4-hydroxy-2-oxoglutarate aldolase